MSVALRWVLGWPWLAGLAVMETPLAPMPRVDKSVFLEREMARRVMYITREGRQRKNREMAGQKSFARGGRRSREGILRWGVRL